MIRINQRIHYKLIENMKFSCKYTDFHDNGNKLCEIDFINGKRHGKSILWYADCGKYCELDYVNGTNK